MIGLEELDMVQADLETLLASAGKRLKILENEMQVLTNWQEKSGEIKPFGKVKSGKVVKELYIIFKFMNVENRCHFTNPAIYFSKRISVTVCLRLS